MTMKKLLLVAALLCTASLAQAQTVTCTISGLSTKQTAQLAAFLADVNAHPPQGAPVPFATFAAYCGWNAKNEVLQFIQSRNDLDASKVGAQAVAHGDETAPTAQCTAAGLGAGCLKSQVACFVLSGNTTCS
jgi:hypothetical protein